MTATPLRRVPAQESPPGSAAFPGGVLDRLRGPAAAKRHNARTIAALTGNPGCTRRAVLDAAGIDKPRLAQRVGFPGNFGQSRFALARGNAFEAMLKANNGALLLETLARCHGVEAVRTADNGAPLGRGHGVEAVRAAGDGAPLGRGHGVEAVRAAGDGAPLGRGHGVEAVRAAGDGAPLGRGHGVEAMSTAGDGAPLGRGHGVEAVRAAGDGVLPETLGRGHGFEAVRAADDGALSEALGRAPTGVGYTDLGADADDTLGARHARTRALLAAAAGATLIDHPLLTLNVAGQTVFLEPDLIALQVKGRLQVVEIKSFAIVDGQADSAKVSAAATQAAVYVFALRSLLSDLGHDPHLVGHEVVLVCPENFSLRPVAVVLDVRKQLATLRRQLTRLASVADIVSALPPDLTFDLTLAPETLTAALARIEARYAPECLSACELAAYCRHEATGTTAVLGRPVRDALGGVDTVGEVLALAAGTRTPTVEQAEAAMLLRAAARLRAEALS